MRTRTPGRIIRAAARWLCAGRTVSHVIEPAIADVQHERDAALAAGRPWRARWAVAAGYAGIWKALGLCAGESLLRGLPGDDTPDSTPVIRTIALAFLGFLVATALLVLPPYLSTPGWIRHDAVLLVATLVPQALPIGLSLGLAVGIAGALCRTAVTGRTLLLVFILGASASLANLATREWLIPDSNQMFREAVSRRTGNTAALSRGLSETPLSELVGRNDALAAHHVRMMAAVCTAPLVLAVFSLAMSTITRRRIVAALFSLAGPAGYYAFLWSLDSRSTAGLMRATGMALPLVLLASASWLLLGSAARRAQR
jgi:hypothetical protein